MNVREFFSSNHWWGKLLGALLGYFIGRSMGALFGLLIGNFLDRGLLKHYSHPYWHYRVERRQLIQKVFFEATFSVIGHIAKADGRVSEQEIDMAKTLMRDMGLTREQIQAAQQFFNQGKSLQFDLAAILTRLIDACRDNPELLKLFLEIQYRAAQTDGLSAKKILLLDTIFRRMGLAPLHKQYRFYTDFTDRFNQGNYNNGHRHNYSGSENIQHSLLSQAYAILELNLNATKQETKRAYRKLISLNHPDKLIAQGLPEEMIKIANEKTQKITKAYVQICSSKGW